MHDFLVRVTLGTQFAVELHAIPIQYAYIEWPEIVVKILIDKLIVYAKVMCRGRILWLDILLKYNKEQAV